MKINNQGSLIIEVLVSVAFVTIFSLAIGSLALANNKVIKASRNETEAMALAKEGMEQVLALKNENWHKLPAGDGAYRIDKDSDLSTFVLTESSGASIGNFTRMINISQAYRDVDGKFTDDSLMMPDNNAKRIEIEMTWPEEENIKKVRLVAYVTNWKGQ